MSPLETPKAVLSMSDDGVSEWPIRALLLRYVQRAIEINYLEATKMESAWLTGVHGDYFTVARDGKGAKFHFPIRHILAATEMTPLSENGPRDARLTIEVYRQVFVKGSMGMGIAFPL